MARDAGSRTRVLATLLLAVALSGGGGGSGSVGGAGVLFAAGANAGAGGGAPGGIPSGGSGGAAPEAPEATCRTNPDPLGLYALLGAEWDADEQTLKRAFRRRAVQYYPDGRLSQADGGAMARRIYGAWDVLSDAAKRAHYDRTGTLPPPPAPAWPDAWSWLFGRASGSGSGGSPAAPFKFDFGTGAGATAGAGAAAVEPAAAHTRDSSAAPKPVGECDPAGYYRALGVPCDAAEQQIKRAYAEAEAKFEALARAYNVLSDVNRRAGYDRTGSLPPPPPPPPLPPLPPADAAKADAATGGGSTGSAAPRAAAANCDCDPAGHYRALGVPCDATAQQIKRAFRKLSLRCHPDTGVTGPAAVQQRLRVQRAFEVVGEPGARDKYQRESDPYGLYSRLGVTCDADAQKLTRAYWRALRYRPELWAHHPKPWESIAFAFDRVAPAYRALSDAERRAYYHRTGRPCPDSGCPRPVRLPYGYRPGLVPAVVPLPR